MLTHLIWIAEWLMIFFGIAVLCAIIMTVVGLVVSFYFLNWVTVIQQDQTIIRRIIGWRTALWYTYDGQREHKKFSTWTVGKGELTLERSVKKRIILCEPLWVIYFQDIANNHEVVISFFVNKTAEIRENNGFRWSAIRLTEEELKRSRFYTLVSQAERLQHDAETRFSSILKDNTR